jgi:hypothetical protein
LLQINEHKRWARLAKRTGSKGELTDENLAKHARLPIAVVNGILWRIISQELLVSAVTPLSVLRIVGGENDNASLASLRKLRRYLLRNRDDGLLAQFGSKFYRAHEKIVVWLTCWVNARIRKERAGAPVFYFLISTSYFPLRCLHDLGMRATHGGTRRKFFIPANRLGRR